jgi:hypothetical protein
MVFPAFWIKNKNGANGYTNARKRTPYTCCAFIGTSERSNAIHAYVFGGSTNKAWAATADERVVGTRRLAEIVRRPTNTLRPKRLIGHNNTAKQA